MNKNTNESGRSMVEMLGVIAIIGVISVGAITSMSYVDSYFRTNATLLEVEQVARDINDMYSWAADYSGLKTEQLCDENESVFENCDASNTPVNRWGGSITVTENGDTFKIQYTKVPQSVCERMLEQANETLRSICLIASQSCDDEDENTVTFTTEKNCYIHVDDSTTAP